MAELQMLRDEEVVYVRGIGRAPVQIGRAPINDLVLTDTKISSRHAVIWVDGNEFRIEDLGSRNGTFVNDARINGPTVLRAGDTVRLGPNSRFRLIGVPDPLEPTIRGRLILEDIHAGVRFALRSDRFYIGSGPNADLRIPDAAAIHATLVLHDNGEVWLGTEDDEEPLGLGQPFTVAGRHLLVTVTTDAVDRTEGVEATRYPYRLTARIDGGSGPEAVLEDQASGSSYRVDTENRATLLYVLARRAVDDKSSGIPDSDAGWCSDDEVATGVWGRDKNKFDPNNYHVLVCRLRKELRDAGFDAWFIEKRKKHIRIKLDAIAVD